ncbi:MAG: rod shape-determining protein [Candidatus Blackburnbacteria bacterium RIFCSPHIGHO2_02_FULL_44_20]|uniref:Cell shape-determining protein MreB n=1 Tax=Candidatus Blackburnbacteria bacterium RIFCSPHIGHO2_02_FULL_44_20 TaxID=1797516 RepID=A0A1G1V5R5_9BACT|nr:MAG: rod shape-determining protein [Candidatus Blackburnbacteria bacterium RIFCSPHIGHO2_02_FULL_44_20]OGY11887.1 MAG: rod shape-determining protein [Candidatus Blackburnbacteria bacterium RIFCSPHIGHO2_12_FULL_44_25]
MFDSLFGLITHDIGIDLGTANTLVYVRGKGIVIREPSVIARHKKTKEILAIGVQAKKMEGRTPATIEAIRPLKDGVIADFDGTLAMLSYFIGKVHETPEGVRRIGLPKIPRPRVVIGIPSGVTEVERRAVQEAALSAGARKAYLIEEPMAAAIGAGLSVCEAGGIFVVDMGGGTTEIALISLGGIVLNRGLRIAGDELDEAIVSYLRMRYSMLLGRASAEELKLAIGSVVPLPTEKSHVIRGRDLETGLPKSMKITSFEVREAITPVVQQIVSRIADTLESAPPELVSDVIERGIVLAGGGALLPGFDQLISEAVKIPVWIADDPLTAVTRGTGRVLDDPSLLKKVRVTGGLR